MPDRYRGDRYRDSSDRGEFGSRREGFRGGLGRPDYRDTANRGYAHSTPETDRDENYFGSGRIGYGDGIHDFEPNRTFGSSWRDSTGESNYDYPERRYESTERRAGFGRDAFGLGYGGDWEPEANRRRRFENTRPYEPGFYRQAGYRPGQYPSSESGFETGPYNDRGWWDRAADEVSSWFGDQEAERRRAMDVRGGHRGRGPKNYTRSDERIREDINDRLTDYDYIDASEIDVQVQNAEVTLTGTVNSRHEKRMAEDIVEDISGVRHVENRLRVADKTDYAGRNWGYGNVAGHTDLNRQEADATQQTDSTTQPAQARGRSTST